MRITNNNPVSGVQGRGAKKKTSGSGGLFEPDHGAPSGSASEYSSSSAIQGVDALLALQEVEQRPDQRSVAARHGHDLLDALETMRADLLAGHLSEERLEALERTVSEAVDSGDANVDSVLREIELRVKVELAKLGRFPD